MVAELEAGSRPDAALHAAADVCADVCADHRAALRSAAAAMVRAQPVSSLAKVEDLAAIGCALEVAERTGAPLADVLARVADDIEAAESRSQRVASLTAGPRSSALLLALLPVLGVVLGSSLGARPVHLLLAGRSGQLLLLAGVVLDVLGVLWTRRLVSSASRRP
jgi:tight adherence protein B